MRGFVKKYKTNQHSPLYRVSSKLDIHIHSFSFVMGVIGTEAHFPCNGKMLTTTKNSNVEFFVGGRGGRLNVEKCWRLVQQHPDLALIRKK